jgi:hypothetical protein
MSSSNGYVATKVSGTGTRVDLQANEPFLKLIQTYATKKLIVETAFLIVYIPARRYSVTLALGLDL